MINRKVVVLCNIKPSKLRGVVSSGMLWGATDSNHSKVELLDPPSNVKIGERIFIGSHLPNSVPDKMIDYSKEFLKVEKVRRRGILFCFIV